MLRKSLQTKSNRMDEGGTNAAPRPGDYQLGSLESRAAARAMLESEGDPLFLAFAGSLPSWAPPRGSLHSRMHIAGAGGMVLVTTDDLNDPDLPLSVRSNLQASADRAQSQNRSPIQ